MTLKTILDDVLLESGMSTEAIYVASDNDAVLRLVRLANRSVSTLTRYAWQALRSTHEFTLTSDTVYPLPDDYLAHIPNTFFTNGRLDSVDFPSDSEMWAYLQSSAGGSGYSVRVRLLGDNMHVYEPDSGEVLRFEYLTKGPVLAADGTTKKAAFTADDDTWILDRDMLVFDIVWRYKKLMGLQDWQIDLAESKVYQNTLKGQEAGSQTIYPDAADIIGDPYYDTWRTVPNTDA